MLKIDQILRFIFYQSLIEFGIHPLVHSAPLSQPIVYHHYSKPHPEPQEPPLQVLSFQKWKKLNLYSILHIVYHYSKPQEPLLRVLTFSGAFQKLKTI